MANLLDQYGIKEVADITFYSIDSAGEPGAPVLFIDSAKTTNLEATGEESVATGGKGNAELISWDHSRKATLTISDALFSMKSLSLMTGGTIGTETTVKKTAQVKPAAETPTTTKPTLMDGTAVPTEGQKFYDKDGKEVTSGTYETAVYATWDVTLNTADDITISADKYPGTYFVTADTIARDRNGNDQFVQIVIPRAKVQSNTTINLDAAGDPSVFDMTLKVLKANDGSLFKIIKDNKDFSAKAAE